MKKIEMLFPKNKFLKIIIVLCITILCVVGIKIVSQQMQYQSYLKQAKASEEKEQYIDAVVYYAMASRIKPKKEKPYLRMADCYIERSEFNQANEVLKIGMLNAKEQSEISSKQDEIRSFVNTDINGEKIPEYTSTENLKGKEKVKVLIKKLRAYNGNGDVDWFVNYYKGYFYFEENGTIYRTKDNVSTKEEIFRMNRAGSFQRLTVINDRIFFTFLPYLDPGELSSINIKGEDYKTYAKGCFDNFSVYKGWIFYYGYNDIKDKAGITKVDFSGHQKKHLTEGIHNGSLDFVYKHFSYYVDKDKIMKADLNKKNKDEEVEVKLPPEKRELENWYMTNNSSIGYITYKSKGKKEKSEELYIYDIKNDKEIKLGLSKNIWVWRIFEGWAYIEKSDEKNDKEILYRKNLDSGEERKLGVFQPYTRYSICNNKLVIKNENEEGKESVRILDIDNTEMN
ncbi:tetratricopeptide repeat protein [Anaerostipes sp.]|uniref:tetratricopeptide repeat protein n=1 Tax=Anaerostipes sp. TaxID=1872530 RepID=UPI0025BE8AC7|nr:tetratricopeptide repeat protein [Anaerostipes sp.]MBS7008286.1 tetratricopeptide repeat protein [Anaerostipes sp.]